MLFDVATCCYLGRLLENESRTIAPSTFTGDMGFGVLRWRSFACLRHLELVRWQRWCISPCLSIRPTGYRRSPNRSGYSPSNIANRRFVVDETIGSVVAFCTFGAGNAAGGSGAPDAHLFRVENGKLRYVHTVTHLLQANFRGGGPGRGAPPNNKQ